MRMLGHGVAELADPLVGRPLGPKVRLGVASPRLPETAAELPI
jgi:hypothetical protein